MARCNEAIPLSPISSANRCAGQHASSNASSMGTISPIISVSSVNGESGDIVLKNLVIGEKVYNGSNEIHIYANDLGLEKAVIYRGRYLTKDTLSPVLAEAEVGDLFFCAQDKLFYLSVGEGDYKCFVSDKALEAFNTEDVPSKVEMELDTDYKLTTKLFNDKNELLCESYPIELPYEIKDIIKSGYYDSETNEIVFVLYNDREIRVQLSGIIDEFQPKITDDNKLSMSLVEGLPSFTTNITARVANEETLRAASDANEAADRQAADEAESTARQLADEQLTGRIDEEILNRKSAEDELTIQLETEVHQREIKDRVLEGTIDSLNESLMNTIADLSSESVTRENADSNINERIDVEILDRSQKDLELESAIQEEKNARKLVDGQLSDRIDSEIEDRISADEQLADDINAEQVRATAIETSLGNMLHTLDSELHTSIGEIRTSVELEKSERSFVDGQLASRIDNEKSWAVSEIARVDSSIESEASTRALIDGQLSDAINSEAETRALKDNELHDEIAALPKYTIREVGETPEYIKVYKLLEIYPSGTELDKGTINIPKDFLVKAAKVYVVTEADKLPGGKFYENDEFLVGDKYIDFTINVHDGSSYAEEHIYLNVKSLVDVYTGGVGITISSDNIVKISDEVYNVIINTASELSQEKLTREQEDAEIRHNLSLLDNVVIAHKADYNNPHQVTKAQVGLGNVDNTADIDKPISTAVGEAILEEKTRAITEEARIESDLRALIEQETSDRIEADSAEETLRKDADTQISIAISNLSSLLGDEVVTRRSQIADLQNQLNAITSNRTSYSETIVGNGSQVEFQIFHNLNTKDVMLQIFDITDGKMIIVDNIRVNENELDIIFRNAPIEGKEYRVLCQTIESDIQISYNANGGTGTMPITVSVKGRPAALSGCGFEAPEGFKFKAWAVGSPEGIQVTPPTPYTFNTDSEVYAIWETIEEDENIHYGLTKNIPTSIDGLTGTYVSREDLLLNGLEITVSTDEEHTVIAIKKELNIALEKVQYESSGMIFYPDFLETQTEDDIIYYDEYDTTSIPDDFKYLFMFKTV